MKTYDELLAEARTLYPGVRIGRPGKSRGYWATIAALRALRLRYDVHISGREHVGADPAILVGNHIDFFDPVVVVMSAWWRVSAFTKVEWFEHRSALFFRLMGQIPLRRGDPASSEWAMQMSAHALVNGGKLARVLVAEGRTVVLGAADTFRAAAAEQLTTWGERVGVTVVRSEREGADPASVAFDAVRRAADEDVDVVVVDTAGRLQNKAGLMDELGKIKRVMEKVAPVGEILLVLDATTGQNGMRQAQVFSEAVGVTGIVLTKLDGTAKGGIVVTVQKELGVPVKLVGLGEGADDLAPFDPEGFVDALLA